MAIDVSRRLQRAHSGCPDRQAACGSPQRTHCGGVMRTMPSQHVAHTGLSSGWVSGALQAAHVGWSKNRTIALETTEEGGATGGPHARAKSLAF